MTNETKSLSEQLGDWRCERPDEWKMDEFIRMAEQLQARNAELEQDNTTQHDLIIRQSEILTNAVNAAKGKPEIGLHSHHDLAEVVAELVQQNRELVAHVELVKKIFITLNSCHLNSDWNENAGKLRSVIMQTPTHSLAERDAEVARGALIALRSKLKGEDWEDDELRIFLGDFTNEYAERVKRGEL